MSLKWKTNKLKKPQMKIFMKMKVICLLKDYNDILIKEIEKLNSELKSKNREINNLNQNISKLLLFNLD